MSRSYHEPVEVRLGRAQEHGVRVEAALPVGIGGGDGRAGGRTVADHDDPQVPAVFLWRGRVHLVRAVLGQWSLRVPWWRSEEQADPGSAAAEDIAPDVADRAGGDLERTVWRVEAGAGRAAGTGVYDLVQGEQWWLERVAD